MANMQLESLLPGYEATGRRYPAPAKARGRPPPNGRGENELTSYRKWGDTLKTPPPQEKTIPS